MVEMQLLVNSIRMVYPAFAEAKYKSWDALLMHFNDICEENTDKKSILIGECKWNAPDYAERLLRGLKAKADIIPQFNGYDIKYVLFLREPPIDADSIYGKNVTIIYPKDIIELLS